MMITHNDLINHLILSKALLSTDIIEAFKHIDRINFVINKNISNVYGDYPLEIGYSQTISQPSTVALMMEMLEPKKGDKILDIGSGSGWSTALLAFIVGVSGSVVGIERVEQLVEFGSSNLKKFKFKNAKIIQAGDKLGIPNETFDRILVSAAAENFPYELIKQLKTNGKLVIPVKNSIFEITKKEDGMIEEIEHYGFRFVPLIV